MKIPKYKPRHRWPIHSNATNQFATQKHKRISSYTTKYGQNACSNKQNETQQDFMPVWSIHIWRRLGNHNRPHSLVLQQRLTNKLCHQSCHTDCFLLKPLCNWTVSNSSLRKQVFRFTVVSSYWQPRISQQAQACNFFFLPEQYVYVLKRILPHNSYHFCSIWYAYHKNYAWNKITNNFWQNVQIQHSKQWEILYPTMQCLYNWQPAFSSVTNQPKVNIKNLIWLPKSKTFLDQFRFKLQNNHIYFQNCTALVSLKMCVKFDNVTY